MTFSNGSAQRTSGGDFFGGDGGAILNFGTLALVGSVVTSSKSNVLGGGIHVQGGTLTMSNTTVANNRAVAGAAVAGAAGGQAGAGGAGGNSDIGALNFVPSPGGAGGTGGNGRTGGRGGSGGTTAGAACTVPRDWRRPTMRPWRTIKWPADGALRQAQAAGAPPEGGPVVDIGAYESPFGAESLLVTTLADEDDGSSNPALGGGTSLREAVNLANFRPGADAITFAPALGGGVITLGGAQLPFIQSDISIVGLGAARLTIDADRKSRFAHVFAGASLALSGLTIRNGSKNLGGDIYCNGTLTVNDCVFSGNFGNRGGAICVEDGTARVSGSTIFGNSVGTSSGGISSFDGPMTLTNTIVAGNFRGSTPNDIATSSNLSASSYNLIGDANTSGGLVNGANGNLVGVDPLLGALPATGGRPRRTACCPTALRSTGGQRSDRRWR